MESNAMLWFRKGLRIHDNPALEFAISGSKFLFPVFVLDPHYLDPDPTAFSPGSALVGINRIQFLLESLLDLDSSLRRLGSRLIVIKGEPVGVVSKILKDWNIGKLCFESDTEPYAQCRDSKVMGFASQCGIRVLTPTSHTLFDPAMIIQKLGLHKLNDERVPAFINTRMSLPPYGSFYSLLSLLSFHSKVCINTSSFFLIQFYLHKNGGKPPSTYQSFLKIAGEPPAPQTHTYSMLPPVGELNGYELLTVPTIYDLGYTSIDQEFSPFRGGESEALKRLKESLENKEWVAKFEKPKGDPSAFLKPATTTLSPYLKFGCLSSRYFYQCLTDVYRTAKKHTSPPVSLAGQLLWRDFFYTVAFGTPNFDRMRGNRICKQIAWKNDEELLVAWREGRTGYPWIDAIMIQLKEWGWMHHLARHSVACFLTRGDLFIHWEKGRDVFERLLIDSDWAINNGNWLWLSCSSFFYQYHRIYSPTTFGKKYDPSGKYIRHFLPMLKDMPSEYIYDPWTAPLSVQQRAKCIIGVDYPKPVVDHNLASKECKRRMGASYSLNLPCDSVSVEEKLNNLRRKLDENEPMEFQNITPKKRLVEKP